MKKSVFAINYIIVIIMTITNHHQLIIMMTILISAAPTRRRGTIFRLLPNVPCCVPHLKWLKVTHKGN